MSASLKLFIRTRAGISLLLLIVVYLVGIISVLMGHAQQLMLLTPFNLLFAAALMLFNAKGINLNYIIWFSVVGVAGYGMEWLGIETGLVFGSYSYGAGLGIKLFDVPLLIGVNWAVLVFSVAAISRNWKTKPWLRAAGAAALMVLYDILLEPVAIRFDFWSWEATQVPLQNYLAWWAIAWLMLLAVNKFVPNRENFLAPYLLIIQSLFFLLLILTGNLSLF
ncbi:MAG TPA: carotenoid biosynthesis protein [Bacteroidales bacterium]|nr:carotenoid biosynthesis protein [Bacteroidales bacterium]